MKTVLIFYSNNSKQSFLNNQNIQFELQQLWNKHIEIVKVQVLEKYTFSNLLGYLNLLLFTKDCV